MSKDGVALHVYRFDPGASALPHYDDFQLSYSKGLTVLDALIYIYENIDSSLSFRWSCKNVQCGTCGMLVNGEAVLACERQLESGEVAKVEPFPIPIIKDLITDFSSIEDRRVRVFSDITPAGRPENLSPREVNPLISLHRCLDCHICDVVCPLNKGKARIEPQSFLPSDLVQLASIIFNRREREDRIGMAYSKKVYHCLTCGMCVEACPVDIDIVNDAIEKLRQRFMVGDGEPYKNLFDPKDWVERWVELKDDPFLSGAQEEYTVTNPKGRIGLFVGCLMNRCDQDLAKSTIIALNRAQWDVIVPKDQKCCGQPFMRLGMVEEARELLQKNISIFEATGVSHLVTACPDCSFAFREDYRRLLGDGDQKPRFEVLDPISFLPVASSKKWPKMDCHNPCYLSRQGVRLSDELVKGGFEIGKVIDDCCGAGGGVFFTNPSLAEEICKKTAHETESNILVTGCPFCKEQFEKILKKERKVIHYMDIFI